MEDEQIEAAALRFMNLIYLGQRALLDTPGLWLGSCERVIYGTACAWHIENTSTVGRPMAVFV